MRIVRLLIVIAIAMTLISCDSAEERAEAAMAYEQQAEEFFKSATLELVAIENGEEFTIWMYVLAVTTQGRFLSGHNVAVEGSLYVTDYQQENVVRPPRRSETCGFDKLRLPSDSPWYDIDPDANVIVYCTGTEVEPP